MTTFSEIVLLSPLAVQAYPSHTIHILDARPYKEYCAGHIPGAVWIGWESWCEQAPLHAGEALARSGYWGVLRDDTSATLRGRLEALGIRNDRPLLVYADGARSKGREARIAWMLLYYGVSCVALLDGGWSGWLRSGGESARGVCMPRYGQVELHRQKHRRIQLSSLRRDYCKKALPTFVDLRSLPEFQGQLHHYQPRLGRLPLAVHFPYTALFDAAGNFITRDVYLQHLPARIRNATRLVAYCEVGVRSCLFALLHELYTGQAVANYDGSLMEWALDDELPMERDLD